ncbi:hypothetical protein CCR96_02710 [Halochromatium roseum]|nr:hypothetical protein [Halochromatium roseum]
MRDIRDAYRIGAVILLGQGREIKNEAGARLVRPSMWPVGPWITTNCTKTQLASIQGCRTGTTAATAGAIPR